MTADSNLVQPPPPPPPPAAEVPRTPRSFDRIIGVLFSPDETFREIAAKPNFLVPLLILFAIAVLCNFLIVPHLDFDTTIRESMAARGVSPDDRAMRFAVGFAKMTAYSQPVLGPIGFVIIAAILLLAFRLFGGEGNFKQAFSVVVYSWFPIIFRRILTAAIIPFQGSVRAEEMATVVKSNLAFLADYSTHRVLFTFLSSIDIFMIWCLFLLIVGFAAVSKFSKAKSAAIVISLWAFLLLIGLGLAAAGAAKAKAAAAP